MRALIIGCGNLLRGDDGVGPEVVRRLAARGLPEGVGCVDVATAGIDVALSMRSVPHVIVVDACRSGSPPGTLIELSGEEVEELPPPSGISVHALRWDHALAFARWRLAAEYPARVTVLLIEGGRFEPGEPLSPAVEEGVERLCRRILRDGLEGDGSPPPGWHAGPREETVPDGRPVAFLAGDVPGIVVRTKTGLRAFRSRCAHAGLPLDTASIDGAALVCRWHAFRFDADTGACLTARRRGLEGWPLRVVDGLIWVCPAAKDGSVAEVDPSQGQRSEDG